MSREHPELNLTSYDAIAHHWDEQRIRLSPSEARILTLLTEGLEPGSVVLDLGCGTGRPIATHLAAMGFRICGIDQSPAMLALAQTRLPAHQWIRAEIESVAFDRTFAAAIAWDSLFHIPRAHHEDIFARVRRALPTGGRFALTAGGSDHPAFIDSMLDQQFFYDSHPPSVTMTLLEGAGFRIEHQEYLNVPDGARDKGRIALVAAAAPRARIRSVGES
jgi:cyclopropane fatty-acyl-phospholipid synthase-like methyltransferase